MSVAGAWLTVSGPARADSVARGLGRIFLGSMSLQIIGLHFTQYRNHRRFPELGQYHGRVSLQRGRVGFELLRQRPQLLRPSLKEPGPRAET